MLEQYFISLSSNAINIIGVSLLHFRSLAAAAVEKWALNTFHQNTSAALAVRLDARYNLRCVEVAVCVSECVEINYSMCNSNKMIIITGLQTRARPRELYNTSNLMIIHARIFWAESLLRCVTASPGVRNTRKMHRRPIKNALLMRDVCNTQRCWDNNATHKSLGQSKQKILDFHSSR